METKHWILIALIVVGVVLVYQRKEGKGSSAAHASTSHVTVHSTPSHSTVQVSSPKGPINRNKCSNTNICQNGVCNINSHKCCVGNVCV